VKNDQEVKETLVRYSAPTKYCLFPYGQIWKHMGDGEQYTLYIQASINENEPNWLKMGDFLERVFHRQLNDPLFIEQCLALYAPDISVT
jgi:hypothetical protein